MHSQNKVMKCAAYGVAQGRGWRYRRRDGHKGGVQGPLLMKQKKKEIICFVIYIPGERKRFFFIYEVIVKKKKKNGLLITTHSFVLGTVVIKKQTPLCCGALAKSMYIVKFWTHH